MLIVVFFFLCRPMLRMYNIMTLTVTDTDGYGSMPKLVTGIFIIKLIYYFLLA